MRPTTPAAAQGRGATWVVEVHAGDTLIDRREQAGASQKGLAVAFVGRVMTRVVNGGSKLGPVEVAGDELLVAGKPVVLRARLSLGSFVGDTWHQDLDEAGRPVELYARYRPGAPEGARVDWSAEGPDR